MSELSCNHVREEECWIFVVTADTLEMEPPSHTQLPFPHH